MTVEKLLEEAREEAGNVDRSEWPAHNQKCQSLIDKALALLSNGGWIRVEDGLPKHSNSVFAYGKDGFGWRIVAIVSYNLKFKKFSILSDVTLWMEIPELPKEQPHEV